MNRLTTAQLAALAQAASNARGRFRAGDSAAGGTVARPTAKALCALGLFDHEATSGWRPQAIGVWHQYRATRAGREIISIGRMLAPLFSNGGSTSAVGSDARMPDQRAANDAQAVRQ